MAQDGNVDGGGFGDFAALVSARSGGAKCENYHPVVEQRESLRFVHEGAAFWIHLSKAIVTRARRKSRDSNG